MLQIKYLILGLLILLFTLDGCVSEIDFELNNSSFIIIDGVITNSADERSIYVRERSGDKTANISLDVSGKLFKNGNFLVDLEPENNALTVPERIIIEVGESYHVEVRIGEDESYVSLPQKVMPAVRTDSLTFDLERKPLETQGNAPPQTALFVNLYAHITIPEVQEDRVYYRWQVDESWSFVDQPDGNPFQVRKTCYFTRNFRLNESTIFEGNSLAGGAVQILIDDTPFGESFHQRHYFNAYAHAITEEAYIFYEKVQNSTQAQGDLFQEVPAPIQGNIRNVKGEGTVLGFVEFSLADTQRVAVVPGFLGRQVILSCDPGGAANSSCFNCLLKVGASLERPFYWD